MADEKSPTDNADAPSDTGAPSNFGARWRRTLIIAVSLLIAFGIVAAVFAMLGPAPGVTSPSQSPGVSPSLSPTPSASSPKPLTEAPVAPTDKPPIAIDESAPITPGLTAEISRVEAVEGTARGPGEVAGPSVRMTVTITNSTAESASLNATVVSAYFGAERTPAAELRGPGGSPLPAAVAAETTVTGVYIFTVPEEERNNVTLMIDYSVAVDPLVFQGDIATLINR